MTLGTLGKYELRGTLGRGAMGTVHDGWDPAIDRRVAIKTVRLPEGGDTEAQEALARFKREAQAAGRLSHPNIVGVFDYGETAELAYIVMEFVDGRTLKQVLDGGDRLPLAETLRIMDDILAGLAYSHARGVVHRDIKPANVMITGDGRAKLADFGIARIESSSMTQAGTIMGTPAYMSPEQFMGQTVDHRTDIYSAGVLLYQLLTGERPFEGSLTSIMHKALNSVPPRPSELSVTAPPVLDAVVARAMARRPEDRFADAAGFAQTLRDGGTALDGGGSETPDATIVATPARVPAAATAMPAVQKRRSPLMLAGVVCVVLLLAGAGAFWALRREQPAPTPAPTPAQAPAPAPAPFVPTPPVTELPPPPVTPAAPAPVAAPQPSAPPAPQPAPPEPTLPPPPAPLPQTPPAPAPTVPAPTAPPPSSPAPRRPAAEVAAALRTALATLPCTLARGDATGPGSATLSGLAGAGTPEQALHRAANEAGVQDPAWRISTFDGPYCGALDLLRQSAWTVGPASAGLRLALASGATALHDNQVIALDATMPGFGGSLQVDYWQHDGTVSHLVPGTGYPPRTYAPGEQAPFGASRPGFEGWRVGPPFGTDMIVAIASTAPLFERSRPESEPAEAYLRDLQAAITTLRSRGGTAAGNALVVETQP